MARHWNRMFREVMDVPDIGDIQGQDGLGSEKPDLAVDVPVHCAGVGLDDF